MSNNPKKPPVGPPKPSDKDKRRKTPPPPPPKFKKSPLNFFLILIVILASILLLNRMTATTKIDWNEFVDAIQKDQIKSIQIGESSIKGKFKATIADASEETPETFTVDYNPAVVGEKLNELLEGKDIKVKFVRQDIWPLIIAQWIFPLLIFGGFIYFMFIRNLRQGGAGGMLMSFGRSRHRIHNKDKVKVTFEDVAGIEEAKDEVSEIIEFLKNPKKFQRLGGRIPRGVLLVGPPGCGKTLLAKAIAGEADVPFLSISGSDFVEMFVGVGASRVRDLFKQAKDSSPCIIFLDEIDAIGRRRGAGYAGGGHDEREQTLNAILVEMDGFDTNDQVIVIAATNRNDILDHALTRPGRFDRQVTVPLPDLKGRLQILKVHAKNVKLDPSADLERIARGTPMFSGADLAAIINESALLATLANKDQIELTDLEEARDKVRWGRAKKSRVIDEDEKRVTAFHEAGHAFIQTSLEDVDPLHKVSIIPRGPMGGATFALPERDRTLYTRKYCMAQLQVCFGGRIAEEIFCDDISSGAQSDIQQATAIARQMATNWGMSDKLGPVTYESGGENQMYFPMPSEKEYSEKTNELIDAEIKRLIDEAFSMGKELILSNRDKVEKIANGLLKYETLDASDVKVILEGGNLEKPTVGDLLAAEQAKKGQNEDEGDEKENKNKPAQ